VKINLQTTQFKTIPKNVHSGVIGISDNYVLLNMNEKTTSWLVDGTIVLRRKQTISINTFKTFFKLLPSQVQLVFRKLNMYFRCQSIHLLWTLYFLKSRTPSDQVISQELGTNITTMRKYVFKTLKYLRRVLPKFQFSDRFKGWRHKIPSCLVDTMFVKISRPTYHSWEYFNKHKCSHGFLYQVVCCLGKPFHIISFNGPFKGTISDISIFRNTISPMMLKGEKSIADKGYYYEKERCWTPPLGKIQRLTQEEKLERRKVTRIRQLIERIIGRIRTWGCMNKDWNYGPEYHELCATVAAKLTNLELYAFPLK